jgi:hypothetical protein
MFADLSLSSEVFSRFLKYRICDLFVPDSTPFSYAPRMDMAPASHFLDGLKLTLISLSVSDRTDEFGLNEPVGAPPSGVRPVSGGRVLPVPRVAAVINGTLFVVAEAEIVRANFDAPTRSSIPILGVTVLLRVYIDSAGTPRLQAQLVVPEGLGISEQAKAMLTKLASFEQPLPLQSLFNNPLLGTPAQILNVGMRLLPERVVIRVEYGPVELGAASQLQRLIAWNVPTAVLVSTMSWTRSTTRLATGSSSRTLRAWKITS